MILGIFGKSGSGKSTACKYLKNTGFYIIDADIIGHNILKKGEEGYNAVVRTFGNEFLDENGEIIRNKLGDYVFKNNKSQLLSEITHPIITQKIFHVIENSNSKNIAIDAALLHTTKIKDICDALVLITSNKCKERITNRDNISEDSAISRLNSQNIPKVSEFTIENNGTLDELYRKIDNLLKGLKTK